MLSMKRDMLLSSSKYCQIFSLHIKFISNFLHRFYFADLDFIFYFLLGLEMNPSKGN